MIYSQVASAPTDWVELPAKGVAMIEMEPFKGRGDHISRRIRRDFPLPRRSEQKRRNAMLCNSLSSTARNEAKLDQSERKGFWTLMLPAASIGVF
jgi:hypothetical protein